MGIQLDFGGFDPAFLGVSVRFANERLFNFYKAYTASPTPLPVLGLSEDERFEALSITSVLAHEIRHFHDFFLTSYSARVFTRRVSMLIYLLQALPEILQQNANCVPVPFEAWCALDESRRQAQLAWLPPRADGQPWVPIRLPHIKDGASADPGALAQMLSKVFSLREEIRELTYNPAGQRNGSSLQPWQIFELPALFIQMSDLWHTYGKAETNFYFNYLNQLEANPYATMLRLTRKLWDDEGRMMDLNVASAMATWSLLGSYSKDQWKACPTERYGLLWNHLKKTGVPEWTGVSQALFVDWSQALALSTVSEGLREAREIFCKTHGAIESKAQQFSSQSLLGSDYTTLLLRVTAAVSRASEHMVDAFEYDPDAYVIPYHYLQSAERYVNPLYRKVYIGGLVSGHVESDLAQRGGAVQWARKFEGGLLVESLVERYELSSHRFLDTQDAILFSSLIGLVDYLVSSTDRVGIDVQRAGEVFFKGEDLVPFEVFL